MTNEAETARKRFSAPINQGDAEAVLMELVRETIRLRRASHAWGETTLRIRFQDGEVTGSNIVHESAMKFLPAKK